MGFDHVLGQPTAIETLRRALEGDLVHHAYRFEGPSGVGKELTALAFAQALLCTSGDRLGCGRCDACRRALARSASEPASPLHPDLVYVARGFYPPDTIGGKKELAEISVEQIRRVVLPRAAYAPHEGRAQVFLVRDAEQLSISAANALLKTLEEPRPATHFVLLTARSDKLLDTIRSRSLPVRFAPLSDDIVARILEGLGVAAERIPELVTLAGGSVGAALEAADPEQAAERELLVGRLEAAVSAPDLSDAVSLGEGLDSNRARIALHLAALAASYARSAHAEVARDPQRAELAARRHELVLDAIDSLERHGSVPLALTSLVASLRHAWQRRPGVKPPIVVTRR
jgi:DNA polymerase-3 subunit delta'